MLSLTLISCGKESINDPEEITEIAENRPPSTPLLLHPYNEMECIYGRLTFEWSDSKDPEEDHVYYDFQLSENNTFEDLSLQKYSSVPLLQIQLESGKKFYWRIKAIDHKLEESEYSEVRSFYTEPTLKQNGFPFPPEAVNPLDRHEIDLDKVTLSWETADPDGDELTYDLYFGSSNPPVLLEKELKTNTYDVALEPSTTYYWKVVAKDPKSASAGGAVWYFKNK